MKRSSKFLLKECKAQRIIKKQEPEHRKLSNIFDH